MVLLARKDEEGNTQALYDHLHGAGRLASGFEDEFADISRTAAVLHDVGKVAQQFQTYLLSDDGHRGDVQHARQGAFVVNDFFESKGEIEEIAKEILELAISKHHGGLPDCIDESGNRAFLLGFTESDKSNEKYECMFGGAQFPMSILNAACHKVTRPMGYDNIRVWRRDFEIACSLWKKHYIDETRKQHRQEDVITMYLEPNRDDRDYLYGRLLALADNFEESVLRKQGVKDRPTNAIKLMSNFTAKPYTTWGTLWKQLTPYLKSANGGSWFRNEVDDVMALFKEGDFEDNKALSPMFLLGYSCQRRASRRKAQEISQKNNSNN